MNAELTSPSNRDPARLAADTCLGIHLTPEARGMLADNPSADRFFRRLYDKELFVDAIRFMAHFLPKRETVWWGCLCAWHVCRPQPAQEEENALQSTVQWVLEPTEERRRAAEEAGRRNSFETPAGCLAMAVFWSTGSMSRPDLPVVAPPAHLTAHTVVGAILMAAERGQQPSTTCYRQFLKLATEIASGKNRWA